MISVCANELPLVWHGKNIYEAGIYRDTVVNSDGKETSLGVKVVVLPIVRAPETITRMGWNTKMIITGDMTQIDLPRSQKSGLVEALEILRDVEGIGIVELNRKDIVRHKLVTRIVNAYEKFDKNKDKDESINKDGL